MKLNTIGQKTKLNLETYLKAVNQYNPDEVELLIDNVAYQYQSYTKYQNLAENQDKIDHKLFGLANRFYINYVDSLKTLGISPNGRKKLSIVEPEVESETSLSNIIKNALEV